MIRSFAEAHEALKQYVPVKRSQREAYTLDTMRALMAHLGNPQENIRVVHVAGTSGKTSTCYYVARLLQASGKKVGLTVSPHLDEVNERLQVNGRPLPETEFCAALTEFLDIVSASGLRPTYFELLMAMAYWYFEREKVDYAVIETGLGGLLDGSNVIQNPEKLSIITDIGIDHQEVLGETIEEIASQKAGIIQPGSVALVAAQKPAVITVLKALCEYVNAELFVIDQRSAKTFLDRNFGIAQCAVQYLSLRDRFTRPNEEVSLRVREQPVAGRMEVIKLKNKLLILDGAHNAQKMTALAQSMRKSYAGKKITTVLSVVQSNDFKTRTNLAAIATISSSVIVTSFKVEQDYVKESVEGSLVVDAMSDYGIPVEFCVDPEAALQKALQRDGDIVLVTGSLYLLSRLRNAVRALA
jgi:dihydrofolate synthase / folylpolyglutamate synthase